MGPGLGSSHPVDWGGARAVSLAGGDRDWSLRGHLGAFSLAWPPPPMPSQVAPEQGGGYTTAPSPGVPPRGCGLGWVTSPLRNLRVSVAVMSGLICCPFKRWQLVWDAAGSKLSKFSGFGESLCFTSKGPQVGGGAGGIGIKRDNSRHSHSGD